MHDSEKIPTPVKILSLVPTPGTKHLSLGKTSMLPRKLSRLNNHACLSLCMFFKKESKFLNGKSLTTTLLVKSRSIT